MSSIDQRTVRMTFDNAQFKKGAADTQKSLADVNKAADASGKSKGLLNLNSNMEKVQLTASKMQVVTTAALATIATKVTNVATSMASSLTLDPLRGGFAEYEALLTKQNVIMNATGLGAKEVKGYLNELNEYSDQTIYSFSNMTDAVQKFVNAGVDMETANVSIKGIANAAAYAGASSEEANRAMYAFSQSMSLGFIGLQDWNQIENANMGTVQFKEELLSAAEAVGTLTKQGDGWVTSNGTYVSATKGWRDGLQEQWATTEVLNSALGKYADNTTELGKKAFESATEVRTFTAFMDTLKESLESGWAGIFTALFGNLKQATRMWTGISEAVGGVVDGFFSFATTTARVWRRMGGFTALMGTLSNILAPFKAVLQTIGSAWNDAFPSTDRGVGKTLAALTKGLELITRPLQWLADGIRTLQPLLSALFQLVGSVGRAIGAIGGRIGSLIGDLFNLGSMKVPSSGGFVGFIEKIADVVSKAAEGIDNLVSKAGSLGGLFGNLSMPDISMPSLPSLPKIGGSSTPEVDTSVVSSAKDSFNSLGDSARGAADAVANSGDEIKSIWVKIGEAFGTFKDKIASFFSGWTADDVVASLNLAVLSTFLLSLSKLFRNVADGIGGFAGIGEGVTNALGSLEGALDAYANAQKAKLITAYGIAIGILAASLWLLSTIPLKKAINGLIGMAGVMFIFSKGMASMTSTLNTMQRDGLNGRMLVLGVTMILFATALTILARAVQRFATVDWAGVLKASVAIGVFVIAMKAISKIDADGIMKTAFAMIVVSAGLLVFAAAVKKFSSMNWGEFGKGLLFASAGLLILTIALHGFQSSLAGAAAMVVAVAALWLLADVIEKYAKIKWGAFGKGLLFAAASLLVLVVALYGFQSSIGGALAMVVAVGALWMMVGVIEAFAKLDWGTFGKGLGMLAIAFVTIGALMALMGVFSPLILLGAAALLIFGAAMALLGVGVLLLAKGLAALILIGAALGAALAAMAIGAAVALGVFFQTLALQAPIMKDSFLKILQSLIDAIVGAVPMVIDGVKRLWLALEKELLGADKQKKMQKGGKDWLERLVLGIESMMPRIVDAAVRIFVSFLNGLTANAGKLAGAATDLIIALIRGIGEQHKKITDAAVDVVIKLAKGFTDNVKKLTDAGIELIAKFLHDLASSIRNGSSAIGAGIRDVVDAFFDVGVDMIQGLINGIGSVNIQSVIEGLANQLPGWARKILQIKSPSRVFMQIGKFIAEGLTKGIQDSAASSITAVARMMTGTIAMANEMVTGYIQKLDQQAIAARARAQGLAAAANKSMAAAKKTKGDADNKAAKKLRKEAVAADKKADAAEKAASSAKKKQDADAKWEAATSAERADIRSNQAKTQLANAKQAEKAAEAARVQAQALRQQAKKSLSAEQRKKLTKQAAALEKQAKEQAERANSLIAAAEKSATSALVWQKKAGKEAADSFQKQYEAEAKADADADAFEQLTDAEKAAQRRAEAADLQDKADKALAKAKKLAYTNLEKANAKAEEALALADEARAKLDEAEGYDGTGPVGNFVWDPTSEAAQAFREYSDQYQNAYSAAAQGPSVEFNQYNTSPEALSPSEIYRQTNNLLTYATDRVSPAA